MDSFFHGTTAEPRDYQERICAKALSMVDGKWTARDGSTPGPAKSVLIEAPTGAGKTVMGLGLAQRGADRGMSIGFVAMRRNLLAQADEMRGKFGFRIPGMKLISMFEATPPAVDWLVVDEAQHDSTNSMAHIHSVVKPKVVFGLSATPYRTDRAQLAFERVVKDVGIHTLIRDGWLSEYDHYTIPTYSPQSIADLYAATPKKWGKAVVFFLTKDECELASFLLRKAGVRNEVVWAGSDRESQIEDFRRGKVQVLVSMSILAEGFDADDMQTVFIRPSSRLPAVQMGGRVLRKHPSLPVKQIVQCQDTRHPFTKTAKPRSAYLQVDGEFRSLSANANVDEVARQYAQRIIRTETSLPAFIVNAKRKSRARRSRGGDV